MLIAAASCEETPTGPVPEVGVPVDPSAALVTGTATMVQLDGIVACCGSGTEVYANGINDAGLIVGTAWTNAVAGYASHLVTWLGGPTPTDLGEPDPQTVWTDGQDVNNAGMIVGWRWTGVWTAYAYENGLWTDIAAMPGDAWSRGVAVNDDGVVLVGSGPVGAPYVHYFLWDHGGVTPLDAGPGPVTLLEDLNDLGVSAGYYYLSGVEVALRVGTGGAVDLPPLSSGQPSFAFAINNQGQIAGASGGHPVIWQADNTLLDLGLPDNSPPQGCVGMDINDLGQVAVWCPGDRVLVWDSGDYYELGPVSNTSLYGVALYSLNENGQVVGPTSDYAAALWTFETNPPEDGPQPDAGGPYWSVDGADVSFDATGSVGPNGEALSFSWDFGDGTTGTGSEPSHAYSRIGAYRVTLTATAAGGATATASTTATVEHALPLVTAGEKYSCAVRTNGTAACWGSSPYGAGNVPAGVVFSQLSAGYATTCGLRADQTISCYGSDGSGQNLSPPGAFVSVGIGKYHGCALDADGALTCWGLDAFHPKDMAPGPYAQVSVGWLNTCGIHPDGTLSCAGYGYPSDGGTWAPPQGTFLQVSSGEHHACALRGDRSITCWGSNQYGEVGGAPSSGFTSSTHSGAYAEVRAGQWHTCALSLSGTVSCWGNDSNGEADAPTGTFTRLAVGSAQSCGILTDSRIVCWGGNGNGQINVPAEFTNQPPVSQPGGSRTRLENQPAFFNGSASSDPEGGPLTFQWDFGDGGTAAGPTPQHAWTTSGTYTVALTVVDPLGASNTATTTVTVLAPDLDWGLPATCDHEVTGVAFDGTYYYVGEGQFSAFQCITRFDANGAYLDHKVFPTDMRGLHYVPATGKLVTRGYNSVMVEVNYAAGTATFLTSFPPAPDQVQAAADPGGASFWFVNGSQAEEHRLADNGLLRSFAVTTNNPFVIGVSNLWIFTVQGTTVHVYDKATGGGRGTLTLPTGLGCRTGWGLGASATGDRLMWAKSCDRAAVLLSGLAEPGATPPGTDVAVTPTDVTTGEQAPATITFDNVVTAGQTTIASGTMGGGGSPVSPSTADFRLGQPPTYYDVTTTATYSGMLVLCFSYAGASYGNESKLKLLHFENGSWVDVTTSLDTDADIICGETSSLSPFLVAETNEAPVVTAIALPMDPISVDDLASISASFTDANTGDTHAATIDWETGSAVGSVTESGGQGSVHGSRSYAEAGVYTIGVTVTDGGRSGTRSSALDAPAYVVVYDPSAGFVTGGGWFDSPAGACAASTCAGDGGTIGKATFGFVSRYRKGANTPDGNTEFQFQAGGLDFSSTSYEWLVAAGARAQFKGRGRIASAPAAEYGFLITAIDGALPGGGGADRFRIKLWDLSTGVVVYDNQRDEAEDSNAATSLGGGSIVIHR